MSKVTKWAVETAKNEMWEAICMKMVKWDKEHPLKAKKLSGVALAEIAIKDPAWLRQVVDHVRRGNHDIDLYDSDFAELSPMVAEAIKKNNAVDAVRNKYRGQIESAMKQCQEKVIRTAIIGDMDSADLLKAVNDFCKR